MATKEQIGEALKRAHAAGDIEAARKLALAYRDYQEPAIDQEKSENLSNPDFYWNSAREGLAGLADTFLGAPEALGGILKQGARYYRGTPASDLDPIEWPRRVRDIMTRGGLIDENLSPRTGAERIIDAGVQLGTGAFLLPGNVFKNAATAGAAGMSGETVTQVTDSPLAGLLTTLAAPAIVPVAKVLKYGISDRANTNLTNQGRQFLAGQRLVQAAGGNKLALLDKLKRSKTYVKGSDPTTAQAIGDPGLASLQRTFEAQPGAIQTYPGEIQKNIVTAFAERAAEQRRAQLNEIERLIPQQNGATAFQENVRQEVNALKRASQTPADQLIAGLGATVDDTIGGHQIRDIFNQGHQSAKGKTSALFESVDPGKTTQIPVPLNEIKAIVDKYYAVAPDLVPNEMKALMAAAERLAYPNGRELITPKGVIPIAPKPATYAELQALASNASSISHESGKAFKNQLSSATRQIKQELRDAIKNNLNDPAYHEALIARAKQGEVYESGAARKMIKTGPNEAPLLGDSEVLKNFLNGRPEDFMQYIKAMKNEPQALQIAQDYIATGLRNKIYAPSGGLKSNWQDEWMRFIDSHKAIIDGFPELKWKIYNAYRLQLNAKNTAETLESGGARHFISEKDPGKAIAALLGSQSKQQDIAGLMNIIKSPTQRSDLIGGVKDYLLGNTLQNSATDIMGNAIFNRGKAMKFLRDPTNLPLIDVLSKRQQVRLRNLSRDFERTDFLNYAPRARGSDTSANLANKSFAGTGNVLDIAGNKVLGPLYGLLKSGYNAATRDAAQQLDGLIARGLLEPKMAIQLIESLPPESRRIFMNFIEKDATKLNSLSAIYGLNKQEDK